MVLVAIISLLCGILCGQLLFSPQMTEVFALLADATLYLLMFAVGISVGLNKQVFRRLREYHFKILVIPFGIVVATIAAGFLASLISGLPFYEGVPVACGLGWYSLSGVLLTNLAGAKVGTLAFLSNLLREIFSFLSIPFVAKHFNHYTAIAPAAATSEDTTLPLLMKYTSEEVVLMAVFNGVLCSAVVPVLIRFFYAFLR
ncbi:MAG: lysine exporter LysO family protein [bacterium]|nr:lysine exporter LysO family protein [bacterium]